MSQKEPHETLARTVEKLRIGQYKRHVLLCTGPTCCEQAEGDAAWNALKRELKDRHLSLGGGQHECFRTKVGCLRVCQAGPVAVVYPEGTWYGNVTADRVPRLVQEHVVDGKPVTEWAFAANPLSADTPTP